MELPKWLTATSGGMKSCKTRQNQHDSCFGRMIGEVMQRSLSGGEDVFAGGGGSLGGSGVVGGVVEGDCEQPLSSAQYNFPSHVVDCH